MSGKSLENGEEKVSDSSSNEQTKEMSIDRLSALPDGILIHILSFLGVEKSAVTSVLSKRWKFIWTELPRLVFRDCSKEESDKTLEFVAKVNRTLLIRSSTHLKEFYVYFRYDGSFASDVDSWLDFVVKNKAKDVGLILKREIDLILNFGTKENLYSLPEMMYSNSSLTWFRMRGCLMDSLTKIEWQSLTWLDIKDSELRQHVIESILSGCPVLHTLFMEGCWGFNCLDVKSQNLCELIYREGIENEPLLDISAPYVHTLDIWFDPKTVKLVLRNIKSLVSANINFTDSWFSGEFFISTTKELFEIVKDVQELKLGNDYFKVLSELVVNDWQLPVSRRKCLEVMTCIYDEHNISGIFALLKYSPNLERLAIECLDPEGETWDEAAMIDLDCDLMHLKTVTISQFADPAFGGEPMLTVARTLLKRATVLEEMNIRLGPQETNDYIKGPFGWRKGSVNVNGMKYEGNGNKFPYLPCVVCFE